LYRHLEHRTRPAHHGVPFAPLPGRKPAWRSDRTTSEGRIGASSRSLSFPSPSPLRTAPLRIAETIRAEIGAIEGIAEMQVRASRLPECQRLIAPGWLGLAADQKPAADIPAGKIWVEHTSINPNKAAHIGHLRNAILGDTFVRLLRYAGREWNIQNYIDNTGVQNCRRGCRIHGRSKKSPAREIRSPHPPTSLRLLLLGFIRSGIAVVRTRQAKSAGPGPDTARYRRRGQRNRPQSPERSRPLCCAATSKPWIALDIEYDFLPRESEILQLHFWEAAFVKLKEAKRAYL